MSQARIATVIERLLTDENLRVRFALDRIEAIAELCLRGVQLTPDEIDLFCEADPWLWFVGDEVRREWRLWRDARSAICDEWPSLEQAQYGQTIH